VAVLVGSASLVGGCTTSGPATVSPTSDPAPEPSTSEQLLVDEPMPGTAAGELVDGFPTALVPMPDEAEILLSSALPRDGGAVEISLNVRTEQPAEELLAAVRAPLLAAGFAEVPPAQPDPSLAGQASFSRAEGAEFVLVGVLDRDGVRTMTLGGVVVP